MRLEMELGRKAAFADRARYGSNFEMDSANMPFDQTSTGREPADTSDVFLYRVYTYAYVLCGRRGSRRERFAPDVHFNICGLSGSCSRVCIRDCRGITRSGN